MTAIITSLSFPFPIPEYTGTNIGWLAGWQVDNIDIDRQDSRSALSGSDSRVGNTEKKDPQPSQQRTIR
ncbi:hypothetical protein PHYBLDRAFT_139581 [Phycomyces blakesleeanus NRRL 1555(-)]|uniref:Uncharacterized protein n=1 Tax=Phycomyces blakesleeanus (strain ATCC 8743b / DSM 1359 / FGSC 10004 / NBRC 33097 / NRRL 1555) TaxID=763407 RepID=A0A167QDQ9_PHYB8|nr:hypothetical protein PHYBLDRAFT_139581 [Phycomyces blakesleeanus NRRL 1555(-)]OAD79548.1 hypothetical protein PHYBLDRAFT_139581 [Phycomyces blakesleeanus NRRL 1555(-)]|eukprot:XP_018297588.1 hypothetical protein PHYBLDRAFT_139581 [Phycomyces blakesleeanus NRRL 1555(-)]